MASVRRSKNLRAAPGADFSALVLDTLQANPSTFEKGWYDVLPLGDLPSADRNQPRVPHRREVGNVDHGNRLIEWHRDFGNGHKLTGTRLEVGQINAALGANMLIVKKGIQKRFCNEA